MDLVRTLGVAIDPSAAKSGGSQVSSAFKGVGEAAKGMEKAAQGAQKQVSATGAAMGGAKRAGDLLRETLDRQNTILSRMDNSLRALTAALGKKKTAMDAAATSTDRMSRSARSASDSAQNLAKNAAEASRFVVGLTVTTTANATQMQRSALAAGTYAIALQRVGVIAAVVGMQLQAMAGISSGRGGRAMINVTPGAGAGPQQLLLGNGSSGGQSRGGALPPSATAAGISGLSRAGMVAAGTAITAAGALYAAKEITQTANATERVSNTLRFASNDAADFAGNLEFVRSTSARLGLEVQSTTKEFAKFMAAGKGTEFSGRELRDVFSSVAKASAVLGLSSDETAGTLNALQQMISKGTVQAEELRGQLGERLPGAFQLAARAMGVTTAELGKMLERGEITAYQLLPALGRELDRAFGPSTERAARSLNSEINRMTSAWTDLKVAIFNSQLGNFFTDMIKLSTNALVAIRELIGATGRLPFDASKINAGGPAEKTGRWWGKAPTYDSRLLEQFSYASAGKKPYSDPWLLSQFSYGVARQPLEPRLRRLLDDDLSLMPDPRAAMRQKMGRTTDYSMMGAFRSGMGDATRDIRRGDIWGSAEENLRRVREIGEGTIHSLSNGFTGFFESISTGTSGVADAFKKMASSILKDINSILIRNMIAEPLAMSIGAAFGFGGKAPKIAPTPVSHAGSIVGVGGGISRLADQSMFTNAPRFHNGLAPDEFPAILQRGEAVIPKGQVAGMAGGGGNVTIQVNVDGSKGGTPEGNKRLGSEIARQIEAVIDQRIARAVGPRGILSR